MRLDHVHLRELFIAACDLSPQEQMALMDEQCAEDADLRAALESLLRKDGSALGLLADADVAAGIRIQANTSDPLQTPDQIGRYKVKRLLGQGGMGVVWLATQENPKRDVAVKVIRSGVMSRELRRRFELEAEVLGRLQHPGIAQIYEAGVFDDGSGGRPFFAMEYVDGLPLGDFLAHGDLNLRERLQLFALVCDAVQHAHQKSVVHRDLKPGNILVRSDGQPKILDFGVARALDSDLQATTIHTGMGQLIGTLHYMSPEQVEANAHSVDTRADVYALGVILYQMLTDRLPYDLTDRSITTAARVIAETDPTPLTAVNRTFRGDLNTIVLKALEKDPASRYQSASDFAADIQRYLQDQPILARPATTMYQLRKFAKRNKALVTAVVIAFLAVSTGAVAATLGLVRAQRQVERASAMNAFLESVLIAADSARSGDMRLVDLLKDAGARVDTEFAGHPDLAARVHQLLTVAFYNIALSRECEHHARRWLAVVEAASGAGHPNTRQPRTWIAMALEAQSRLREAQEIVRSVIEESEATMNDEGSLQARTVLGGILSHRGQYEEAETLLRAVIKDAESSYGRFHRLTVRAVSLLAQTLDRHAIHGRDDPMTKESLAAEAVELYKRVIEDEQHAAVVLYDGIHARMYLSDHYRTNGRFDEAAAIAVETLALTEDRLGPDHSMVAEIAARLGAALYGAGRPKDAAPHRIRAVSIQRALDADSILTSVSMADSLHILDAAGEWATALEYAQALVQRFGADGAHGDFGLECRIWLPYLYTRVGEPEKAGPLLDELMAAEGEMDDLHRARLHYAKGVWCKQRGEPEQARSHLESALRERGDKPNHWPPPRVIREAIDSLGTPDEP